MRQLFYIILLSFIVTPTIGFGQNEDDAFRFSNFQTLGSARFNSMSGAFTALGGDPSAIHFNPAGLGVMRRSEFSFSPYLSFNSNEATHLGNRATDFDVDAKFGNVAIVLASQPRGGNKWRQSNFGITFNKLIDYNNSFTVSGVNNAGSLLDVYRQDIENGYFGTYGSDLAWQAYLVDTTTYNGPLEYYTQIPNYGQQQKNIVTTKGDLRETLFSYGANYDDILYIGASVGLLRLRYERNSYFEEVVASNDSTTYLDNYSITDNLNSSGNGVRASLGFIYRPTNYLRIGASIQSPGVLSITDSYRSSVYAEYDSNFTISYAPDPGLFDYSVKTPSRVNAGMAFIFGKYGLLSFDYQLTDYSSMVLRSRPRSVYSFDTENSIISTYYTNQHRFALGAESRYGAFSFRAGATYQSNALTDANLNDYSSFTCSFGAGYRKEHFYADLGVVSMTSTQKYYIYDPAFIEASTIRFNTLSFSLSVGLRF